VAQLHLTSTGVLNIYSRNLIHPYISLAADVCEIKSTIFPNLGSMTHPEISEWLGDMQKKNDEKAQALGTQRLTRQNPR